MFVLGLAVFIWLLGALFKVSLRARWGALALLYGVILGLHLLLPNSAWVRDMIGGSLRSWLLTGGVVAVGLAYWALLRLFKAKGKQRVEQMTDTPKEPTFSETELNRYARHIMLREIGGAGQKKLKQARVLVVGAGGLGSPVLLYLAAAGVGRIGVIDDDVVDNSNLQRQIIHRDADIGMAKVFSAQAAMLAQNPHIEVLPYQRRFEEGIAAQLLADYDLVLDGSDNFQTRYLVNRSCVAQSIPLIAGAISQWEGQISLYDPARGTPCYQCIFPEAPAPGLAPSCAEAGVAGPLPGVIGAMMALEAIKEITGAGAGLRGEMLIYDALFAESRKIRLTRRDDCPVCAHKGGEAG
ncbi:MAG: molybdopterin biosynthesis protein [Rhodobacterales bacterium]|nr:MAG: molybdopterin biosynthesis protein [Rhodobacterales bacterium]